MGCFDGKSSFALWSETRNLPYLRRRKPKTQGNQIVNKIKSILHSNAITPKIKRIVYKKFRERKSNHAPWMNCKLSCTPVH